MDSVALSPDSTTQILSGRTPVVRIKPLESRRGRRIDESVSSVGHSVAARIQPRNGVANKAVNVGALMDGVLGEAVFVNIRTITSEQGSGIGPGHSGAADKRTSVNLLDIG